MKESKKVEFMPPEGFHMPEGSEGEFDLVCTFRMKGDGKMCMTKLGEHMMPGYDGDEHDEDRMSDHKPGYGRLTKGLMESIGESGAPAPDSY